MCAALLVVVHLVTVNALLYVNRGTADDGGAGFNPTIPTSYAIHVTASTNDTVGADDIHVKVVDVIVPPLGQGGAETMPRPCPARCMNGATCTGRAAK